MSVLKIEGGTVYDPANDVDGAVRDIWIIDGVVAEAPADGRADRIIDARNRIVMPGGIDMHCHIAGPKVNAARKMMPDEKRTAPPVRRTRFTRSGTTGSVPSTFATGYLYAGLGYTTAFDAAIPPLMARHAHEELQDTPVVDKGFYVLMGNNHFIMRQIEANRPELVDAYVAWLLDAVKGYAAKLVNPGGVEVWKAKGDNAHGLDEPVPHFNVTPRQIIQAVADSVDRLGLPHPVHIHCNNLGLPGNFATTLETMKSLEGRRGHLTHIQFHSYGGDPDAQETFASQVVPLVEYVNAHPNITVDVGQVLFGRTTSMTGDGPLGYFLHKVTGRKWFNADTEMEAGCGIVPIEYRNRSMVHALQWAIGLEWYLLMDDPWRVAMSTDHPNGASFLAYPQIIALLMDRDRRRDMIAQAHPAVRERSTLADLDREYTLSEIAIITRAAPARILGLTHKGHLGPGAVGDVTIYEPDSDIQKMFTFPRYVIARGRVVVDDGELIASPDGTLFHVDVPYDEGAVPAIREWFERYYTIQFENYPVDASYLHEHETIRPMPSTTAQ
ncbi:MAG: formylmethanofuran dehydrogenase subunit A [Planctomycetota bacterium]|nr:MAG: formylmethanofuran dehydrogenase subunit A [Planctomycetota bacterium]